MTEPKLPRLTLRDARASKTAEIVDQLIDAPAVTAASRIRRLDRHQLELCLMHVVCSLDPRWRIPARTDSPPPVTEALTAVLFAAGDALDALYHPAPQEEQ